MNAARQVAAARHACTLLAMSGLWAVASPATESPTEARAPLEIASVTALAAAPEGVARGVSGPINRWAFELTRSVTAVDSLKVSCRYAGDWEHPCRFAVAPAAEADTRLRVLIDVPDIGRGPVVRIRVADRLGAVERSVMLVNRPVLLQEIESVLLPRSATTDSQFAMTRARTAPRAALGNPAPSCNTVYARWLGANASDVVFTGPSGAQSGSIVLAQAPKRHAPLTADSGPQWLITYPATALRVQFIAHYEIEYRVGECATNPARS